MVSKDQVTSDRRRGIGGRRWWPGGEVDATPSLAWKHRGGDSDGGTVSARKLAASLWRQLAAINNGGVSVRRQCLGFEFCSSASIPKFAAEGITKWDYCNLKAWDNHFESSAACITEADSFKARKRVDKNEERCSKIKNLADGVKRESKNYRNMDMMNSKLLCDIAEAKSSAMIFVRNLDREKKARENLEDVCANLAKEIEGSKEKIGELMKQQKRIEMEVEEERKMLQLAEVWREERLQMKVADARLILEDKYAEIGNLIADVEAFLRRMNLTEDEELDSVNIQHVKNFTCRLPKSSSPVAVIKDSQFSEAERIDDHHDHKGCHNKEASENSLNQSKKKGSCGSKIQGAWSRSKETCKNIMIDGSSDRSIPSMVSQAASGQRQVKVERNPHVVRAMKGHIEWPPRGIPRRTSSLKATLESQKMLLRNVLKQRN